MEPWRTFGPKLTEQLRRESFKPVGDAYLDSLKESFMDAMRDLRNAILWNWWAIGLFFVYTYVVWKIAGA